jgi:hypothetical protein
MSRLRKIYKGEENWDVLYNEQEQILTNPHMVKPGNNEITNNNNQGGSPTSSKIFQEDTSGVKSSLLQTPSSQVNYNFNFNLNKTNLNNQLNKISDKLNTVEINSNVSNNFLQNKNNSLKIDNNNREDSDIQDLIFEDFNNNQENHPEVNERDYENFDHYYESNSIVSGTSSVYKREKRLFSEAFGKEDDAKSIGGQSVLSHVSHVSKKTKKE